MNAPVMRAKMRVSHVAKSESVEVLSLIAVAASQYPADGSDENNTYAKWTPSASMNMSIVNPALHGQFVAGDEFYVDFIRVAPSAAFGGSASTSSEAPIGNGTAASGSFDGQAGGAFVGDRGSLAKPG